MMGAGPVFALCCLVFASSSQIRSVDPGLKPLEDIFDGWTSCPIRVK